MNNVAIETLYGYINYGNRLQNYAVSELIKRHGYNPVTLFHGTNKTKNVFRYLYKLINSILGDQAAKREIKMMVFSYKYLNVCSIKKRSISKEVSNAYSYFVVGSDQVWNPNLYDFDYDRYFLTNCKKNQRICLAPSLGVSTIDEVSEELFRVGLTGFNKLSCREKDGAELIEKLSGKRCIQLIDPTLAIEVDKWKEIEKPLNIKDEYILVFLYGEKTASINKIIQNTNNYRIIDLNDPEGGFYASSPQEFLWLISNAKLVVTDSFHGAAFSINYNTPFYVVDRFDSHNSNNTKMTSRIRSLVNMVKLEDRYLVNDIGAINYNCDFTEANEIIENERKKVNNYLKHCFESKDI